MGVSQLLVSLELSVTEGEIYSPEEENNMTGSPMESLKNSVVKHNPCEKT